MTTLPTIVGIDPSLTATGLCILDTADANPIATAQLDTISSKGTRDDTLRQRLDRLSTLASQAHCYRADLAVIEGPSMAPARGASASQHDRAGLWWLIVKSYEDDGVPVISVPPTVRAKYATGKGNAGKGAVIDAVARRYPAAQTGGDDNLADALVLALIGARMLGHPVDNPPQTHLAALDKLRLPEGATP